VVSGETAVASSFKKNVADGFSPRNGALCRKSAFGTPVRTFRTPVPSSRFFQGWKNISDRQYTTGTSTFISIPFDILVRYTRGDNPENE
jgi:hypothetical protein